MNGKVRAEIICKRYLRMQFLSFAFDKLEAGDSQDVTNP